MVVPSSLTRRDRERMSIEAMHSSAEKRNGLRPAVGLVPCFVGEEVIWRFFWDMAPASPLRKEAKRTGRTPCVRCRLEDDGTVLASSVVPCPNNPIQPPRIKSIDIIFSMVSADPKSKNRESTCI